MLTTIVLVLDVISVLIGTVGCIGVIAGMYYRYKKKSLVKANHIWAYSYFFMACVNALDGNNFLMILFILTAILCFIAYINGREAY